MSAANTLPPEVHDPAVGLMGDEAAAAWWTTRDGQWLGGLTPAQLWADGRPEDRDLVLDLIRSALVGVVPLEGH